MSGLGSARLGTAISSSSTGLGTLVSGRAWRSATVGGGGGGARRSATFSSRTRCSGAIGSCGTAVGFAIGDGGARCSGFFALRAGTGGKRQSAHYSEQAGEVGFLHGYSPLGGFGTLGISRLPSRVPRADGSRQANTCQLRAAWRNGVPQNRFRYRWPKGYIGRGVIEAKNAGAGLTRAQSVLQQVGLCYVRAPELGTRDNALKTRWLGCDARRRANSVSSSKLLRTLQPHQCQHQPRSGHSQGQGRAQSGSGFPKFSCLRSCPYSPCYCPQCGVA